MAKPDPSMKCLTVAELPDPRLGDGTERRTVVCAKSVAHRTSSSPDRRKHFDPSADVYWSDDEAL